ncbi:receptor-like protein kinase HSL1 isoform X1 [Dendrobium catenatum]|uniref:non-specific serine/threonine protein kinase n=2 Tax=Dendrobium catenatum TaxID=906689 RepID=A0A2I0VHC2_9ASPA|nr:receptor-like protein kinase HSL1 isoform X1 [Dendrobium catenatum]PKU62809.1 Receptor-like protein kinase HSL1 [Dendrobium catenatum]
MTGTLAHFLLILFSPLFFHKTSAGTASNEKEILLNLKNDWGNPLSLSSWNLTGDHCKFNGISCSDDGFVEGINLYNSSIYFPIPASICDLKGLAFLNLSDNNIPSKFPIVLYNCSKLQELDISDNYFSGELPVDIYKLPSNLTHLKISGNSFTGDLPPAIGRLTAIKFINLSYNLFNGTIPAEMGNLSTLMTLMLAQNPFSPAKIWPEFGNLTSLTYLWMSNISLLGEIPMSFGKLVNLEHLDLAMNSLVGEIPANIWMIKPLKYIYLYANNLTGEISRTVAANGLVEIDLSMNNLTGSIPEAFGELQNLTHLFLYFNNVSGEIPASIGRLPNLYDIRLFNNRLEGVLPPEMGKYSKLWNFEVDDNMFTGELPEHLCDGKALTCIIVFDNQLTGTLPESLSSCDTLLNVQIQNNQFTGEFPAGIWSAVNLSLVITTQNSLSGTLPYKLPANLQRLEIQNNQFSGGIPSSAGGLLVFHGDDNKFSGELPASFFDMSLLQELSLSRNEISGEIPAEIGSLKHLSILNLSDNRLSGNIPDTMGSMMLHHLDLSKNQLSGEIPSNLGNLILSSFNLSFNDFTGEIPVQLQNQAYEQSFLANPNLCTFDSISSIQTCKNRPKKISAGLLILFSILGALILCGVFLLCFLISKERHKRKKARAIPSDWKLTSFQAFNLNEETIFHSLTDENLVGSGGGGKVYRVSLNRETVAVKKIYNARKLDSTLEKQFEAEVKILGSIRHANIVNLLCCISSENSKLLVYEYLQNGSLDRWLHRQQRGNAPPLDWPTRLQIAFGAARGLCYMHHDCFPPIIHRDVKSSNILLDPEFKAKIADFGLARILEKGGEPETVSAMAGSFGYMAPECGKIRKVSEKVDVYSFGVVLLELATGKDAGDGGEEEDENLTDWAWRRYKDRGAVVDEEIAGESLEWKEEAEAVFRLGVICTVSDPIARPTMKEVVQVLMKLGGGGVSGGGFAGSGGGGSPLLVEKNSSRKKKVADVMEDSDDSGIGRYTGIDSLL